MKSKLLTLLATLLLTPILPAQEGEKVTLRIDFVAWGDAIQGLSLGSAGEGKFNALPFTYSEPVKYSGPAILRLHHDGSQAPIADATTSTPEDAAHTSKPLAPQTRKDSGKTHAIPPELAKLREEDPTIVALVPLPAGSRRVTVLLAPAADGTFQPYVIDDDPAKLPPGKLRIHNLSPFPIAMQFGDGTRAEIKSGRTALADSRDGQAAYRLAYQLDGEWTIQENNIIGVPKNEQTQFIVLKSDNSYFLSSDGATGGFLQSVVLRRLPENKEG
jgi:hypothetical protein